MKQNNTFQKIPVWAMLPYQKFKENNPELGVGLNSKQQLSAYWNTGLTLTFWLILSNYFHATYLCFDTWYTLRRLIFFSPVLDRKSSKSWQCFLDTEKGFLCVSSKCIRIKNVAKDLNKTICLSHMGLVTPD